MYKDDINVKCIPHVLKVILDIVTVNPLIMWTTVYLHINRQQNIQNNITNSCLLANVLLSIWTVLSRIRHNLKPVLFRFSLVFFFGEYEDTLLWKYTFITRAIALDTAMAFDKVWHRELLLSSYVISGRIFYQVSSLRSLTVLWRPWN